jgi:hypothetical protein
MSAVYEKAAIPFWRTPREPVLAAVTDEYWPSGTFIIMQATGRRYLIGKVVSHMTMSLDGFIADPHDGGRGAVRLV